MAIAEKIRDYLIESPGVRTLVSAVAPIISGVLSAVLILEVSSQGELDWRLLFRARAFYALFLLCLLIYLYNRALYMYERDVQRFSDADFCIAYMRSKCLPEAAERYRILIRSGGGGELSQAMNELRKILK